MTKAEAKKMIMDEFMATYDQWLIDRYELSDHDYGWKYGWVKSEKLLTLKDNLSAVTMFQKYIFDAGRNMPHWEKAGYESRAIWELYCDGFLSYRQNKWDGTYFISQKTAKLIYKEMRKEEQL